MKLSPPHRGPSCPPAAELEALAAGEPLPLSAHVDTCPECGPYVAALEQEADAFLRARPPELFLKQVARRAETQATRPWWWRFTALVPLAAALALFFVVRPGGEGDGVTLKGGPFKVFLKRGDAEPAPLPADARVKSGDALRFSFDAPSAGYLAVLELDGRENVTVFWPFGGTAAAAVTPGQGVLPGSVVLDASPGPTWLVAVWSSKPFDTAPLAAQLRGQATRPSVTLDCSGCVVTTQRLLKP